MQKRATFTTLHPMPASSDAEDRNNTPSTSKKWGTGTKKDKKKKGTEEQPVRRTVRLQIELTKPSKDSYMELHYDEEIRKRLEAKSGTSGDSSGRMPGDNEDDEDVVRLARAFDQKYGGKKGRSGWEDYVDKGMGYDETDPFIDNDEAYDELIPSSLTTKYGGFYVNCGPLDFKPVAVSEVPDDAYTHPLSRAPVAKRRKSVNGSSVTGNHVNKKKKKDHQSELRTVAQMIDQKRTHPDRDTQSPDQTFLHPVRKSRPVIADDGDDDGDGRDQEAGNRSDSGHHTDGPGSQTIDDVIDCVARGRANGAPVTKTPNPHLNHSTHGTDKQSVIRMAGEQRLEGLALSSMARMVSVTGRSESESTSSNNGQHQHRTRPTDLSQNSSRPQDTSISVSPGFRQHPGLVDHEKKVSPVSSASTSLLSRTPAAAFLKSMQFDRSPTPHRTQPQTPTEPQTKQSPTSAAIRSSFQSVIKTSVDSKKLMAESATMDSLMEKVISNSLSKFPNSSSTPFGLQSSGQQLQAKTFKTPPAAHQQPKNSFVPPFLDSNANIRSSRLQLDAMIMEHFNADLKSQPAKGKTELSVTDNLPHAKVVKEKGQYRIPNLPHGQKAPHCSSSPSNRPNSLSGLSTSKQQPQASSQGPSQHHSQSRSQKTVTPAVSPVPSPSNQPAKGSNHQKSGSSRSSPSQARHSPLDAEAGSHYSFTSAMPNAQQLWNPMMYSMYDPSFLTSRSPPISMAGVSGLSRPVSHASPNLPTNQFLNLHSYAAPPSGGKDSTS